MKENKHRVVFQLNTEDINDHNALMTYVSNVKRHWGDNVDIHVVVHGPGIGMVMKSKTMVGDALKNVIQKGIKFFACQNTMNARMIDKNDIIEEVSFVESGLVDIIEKQENGWAYIKCNL
ncbi:DsrE family protein [Myroides injenensis]|uniref:DsrE family protein n=1 Tax=Myroides injenensis TaxID=1183151 RepID=UPI0002893E86|nr:DsrE family protein [Myroides injenensis]